MLGHLYVILDVTVVVRLYLYLVNFNQRGLD